MLCLAFPVFRALPLPCIILNTTEEQKTGEAWERGYAVLLCSSFLFNVVSSAISIRQYLRYGRVRDFMDLTCVHNTVESRHYLYRCADWSILAKAKMKIEGKFPYRTTTPECSKDRRAVPSVVKTEGVCNFQLTFIQPMHLLVIDFGLAHRLLNLFICHMFS